jgi:hypothetical protein
MVNGKRKAGLELDAIAFEWCRTVENQTLLLLATYTKPVSGNKPETADVRGEGTRKEALLQVHS